MNALELIGTRPYTVERENQYLLRCPAHEDKTASLAVAQKGPKVLMYCFAGCSYIDILRGFGLESGALKHKPGEPSPSPAPPKVELPPLEWEDVSRAGEALSTPNMEYLRDQRCIGFDTQKQACIFARGGRYALPVWQAGLRDVRLWLPPEGRTKTTPKILSWQRGRGANRLYPLHMGIDQDILLCAGELDALALRSIGLPAVTTTGSESSFPLRIAEELKALGVKTAHILLDADECGEKGSVLRKSRLESVGIKAGIISWPKDRPPGHDASAELLLRGNMGAII